MTQSDSSAKKPFIWFDLDDTIWDMTGNSCIVLENLYNDDPSIQAAYSDYGPDCWIDVYHRINAELWRDYAKGDISQAVLRLERFALPLEEGGLSREEAVEAAKRLDEDYLYRLGSCTAVIPGTHELLKALAADGRRMGIVSNGFRQVQYRKLSSAGIYEYFDPIILSDDTGINKPHPEFFEYALEKAGVTASESIIIGDNPITDILGALNAGFAEAYWLTDASSPEVSDLSGWQGRYQRAETLAQIARMLGYEI